MGDFPSVLSSVPAIDSAANLTSRDGIGNKDDSITGNSLFSLVKQSLAGGAVLNVPQFAGDIYYVDDVGGSDLNTGASPVAAFETIGMAILTMSDGDAITVKAGTYTETGLDLSNDAAEMWCEIGVVIDPATGTALVVSGDHCRVSGNLDVDTPAGEIGLVISGDYCVVSDTTVRYGATGVHVTGVGVHLSDLATGLQTVYGFDLDGSQARLNECSTVGAGASIGYNIGTGANIGVLRGCTSANRQTAGYYIETGAANWTLIGCSSGAGDGRWVDVDNASVWSNFTYDAEVYHLLTFAGGGPASENLFRVYGTVEFQFIGGDVETILAGDIGNLKIEMYDGSATNITANVAASGAIVESLFYKTGLAVTALSLYSAAAAQLIEKVDLQKSTFAITAKAGTPTYVRATWSGNGTSGAIHWHSQWKPITEDGFVEAV